MGSSDEILWTNSVVQVNSALCDSSTELVSTKINIPFFTYNKFGGFLNIYIILLS